MDTETVQAWPNDDPGLLKCEVLQAREKKAERERERTLRVGMMPGGFDQPPCPGGRERESCKPVAQLELPASPSHRFSQAVRCPDVVNSRACLIFNRYVSKAVRHELSKASLATQGCLRRLVCRAAAEHLVEKAASHSVTAASKVRMLC